MGTEDNVSETLFSEDDDSDESWVPSMEVDSLLM